MTLVRFQTRFYQLKEMKNNIFPEIESTALFNEPLFKHTTFRIGGPCRVWVEVANETDLKKILFFGKATRKKIFIIGTGSNVLVRDRGFKGIVMHLSGKHFTTMDFFGTRVRTGAAVLLSRLVYLVCRNGLAGLEGLAGIPGTVGGAIFMNSSYKQNISDYLEEIKVMDKFNGNIQIIKRKNIERGYRHSNLDRYIILEATFRLISKDKKLLLKKRSEFLNIKKREQPLASFSAGCIFRNPDKRTSAARYIDMLGLKGKRIGDAKISERHANFIVNVKKAKSADVLRLITFIKKCVKSQFNVDLTPEVIII